MCCLCKRPTLLGSVFLPAGVTIPKNVLGKVCFPSHSSCFTVAHFASRGPCADPRIHATVATQLEPVEGRQHVFCVCRFSRAITGQELAKCLGQHAPVRHGGRAGVVCVWSRYCEERPHPHKRSQLLLHLRASAGQRPAIGGFHVSGSHPEAACLHKRTKPSCSGEAIVGASSPSSGPSNSPRRGRGSKQ
jgi:hypothetical protein